MLRFLSARAALHAVLACLPIGLFATSTVAERAQPAPAPVIATIDPPQWWANMPAAMLLVRGENLGGCRFSTSDPSLAIGATTISANGHWAAVHLGASPAQPEPIKLTATCAGGTATFAYTFGERRNPSGNFAGFSSKDVLYLIMTDRFADGNAHNDGANSTEASTSADAAQQRALGRGWHGGDIQGVTDHLDYLQSLGITTVWITPVYDNDEPESYHGYGATNLYAVDPHYGTLADLQQLSAQLHQRHMKLVVDIVPNHIGPNSPWVTDEPEPDWFHGTKADHHAAVGEFAPLVNPHAPWRDQREILQGWFANVLPDMNQENPDVAQYLTQNTIWWVEQTGADGIRIDTFPYVGRPFWHSFHASLHQLYPALTSVGEVFNKDPVITSAFATGVMRDELNGSVDTGLTTPFDFPTYFALRDVLVHGQPMTRLAEVLRQDSLYPHPERLVPFLGNHDTKRFLSEDGATPDKLKLGFAMLLTMRGMPQLYSGDEIAMSGGDDPDNRHDFPGGFPGSAQSAFLPAERTTAQRDMFDWVQHLLQLRAQYAELNSGGEQLLQAGDATMVWVRGDALDQGCDASRQRIVVTFNKAAAPAIIPFDSAETALSGCSLARAILGTLAVPTSATTPEQMSLSVPAGATITLWK